MLKGINVWAFAPNRPLNEVFSMAKAAGFEAVEVAVSEEGQLTPDSSQADCEKILEMAADAGIAICGLASGLGWKYPMTSTKPEIRQRGIELTAKSLQVANWLATDTLLVVPGIVDAATPYHIANLNAHLALSELCPMAERLDVTLGIENVWNKFLLSPLEMTDFLDDLDTGCAAYLDVGNVVLTGYPEHWIAILGDRICRVHFKDFKRSVGTLAGFCPLLEGDVDFPAVISALREIGYAGPVVSEFFNCEAELGAISRAMDLILAM